ncbi:hypothetical protein CHS0354_007803 [Potamilus streckersoni]|uniref:Uncharacterized protein n=1 Tax=Potamilus streckersoni TaxID=2493646 RepID=A0AAE0VRX5_9BIVA|nr:hypothetical protein CHS0354_007803 [Potamilus streckersoni]
METCCGIAYKYPVIQRAIEFKYEITQNRSADASTVTSTPRQNGLAHDPVQHQQYMSVNKESSSPKITSISMAATNEPAPSDTYTLARG